MDLAETDRLLTVVANVDNRRVDDATVLVWHEILGKLPFDDCLMAATSHFGNSEDYLMPVHIVRGAREVERQRIREANQRKALELTPETDPRPLTNRAAEILEYVRGVRDALPESSADVLRHGHRYWRENSQRQRRLAEAVPNPHYDPQAQAALLLGEESPQ